MQESSPDYQPIQLVPNIRYPTYQLHALAGSKKGRGEAVFRIAVLETVKWLRQRFRAFELPDELNLPDPDDYEALDLNQLTSFHLDVGYRLEVIWLPNPGIWVLQLTEPDLGARSAVDDHSRAPVPGRLFETNVSYRLGSDQVECAFKTVVHEPVGTEAECEVFRLAFIKHLVRNPRVGLVNGWPLDDQPHVLATKSDLKRFQEWITSRDRTIPAVVMTEYRESKKEVPLFDLPKVLEDRKPMVRPLPVIPDLPDYEPLKDSAPVYPYYAQDMARYRMGYAHIFLLPAELMNAFADSLHQSIQYGETLILEPEAFGGKIHRFPYGTSRTHQETTYRTVDTFLQNYPKGKDMSFGHCLWLEEARELIARDALSKHRSVEEVASFYEQRLRAVEKEFHEDRATLQNQLSDRENKIVRLQDAIHEVEMEKQYLREERSQREREFEIRLDEKNRELEYWVRKQCRPDKPSDVLEWVEQNFEGKLCFHERARDLMEKTPPDRVNMELLCDALEYLAEEYRDELLGTIDGIQRDRRCSEKYGRPFQVVPTKGPSVNMYPNDYKIKYYIGHKGKPVESLLDLHLKVGNDPDSLLRIYFLYDKEKKMIVVGSLPEHLRTVSYR